MRKLLPAIILLFTAAHPGAQEETDGRKRGIHLRGFAFALFEGIDRLELRHEEKTVGELLLPTGQLRNRTAVSARAFSYGIMEGEKFRSLGHVALPAAGRDFILVFAPEKDGYKAFPVRADDPDFGGDDVFLFNFTPYRIAILLGTAKQQVKPWDNALLHPAFASDALFYQAMFAYEKDGTLAVFNNTRWPVNPNTKALVFVFHDEASDRLMYRSVTELAGH